MQLIDSKVPAGEWTLRLTSDWQLGASSTSNTIIDKILEPVHSEKNYRIAFLGDLMDNISVKDKRHSKDDLDETKPDLLSQMSYLKRLLAPVAKKTISLGAGNHEFTSLGDSGDPTKYLAEDLNVPYGGYSAVVRLNKMDEILLWHGRPSISSTLPDAHSRNMALKRRLVRTNRARWPQYGHGTIKLFAQGHVNHLMTVSPEESLQMDMGIDWNGVHGPEITNKYEISDAAWYACCGSAQRLYVNGRTTYAEAKGYGPLSLGCVDVRFKGGKLIDAEAIRLG